MSRDDKLATAGDYVLGVLDDAERSVFEQAMAADRELMTMVDRLAARLHHLDDTVTPEPVAPGLWGAIDQRIAATPQSPTVAPIPFPTRTTTPSPAINWMAMAASVVVALGIGYAAGLLRPGPAEPVVVAVLLNEADASPGAIIEAYADDSVMLTALADFTVPQGKILQVWTLPDVQTGPVSLGTLAQSGNLRLAGPDLPVPQDGQLYEITLEPAPGSPTGRPTGPILVKGFAKLPLT